MILLFIVLTLSKVTSISFKEKCESHVDPSLFYNDRCYLSTTTLHSTNYSNWLQLHEQCKHFPSPKLRHLAFVKDNNHLQLLQNNYVIHPEVKYFVGNRDISICNDYRCCPDKSNWAYIDDKGVSHGKLNPSLWLRLQPDNLGNSGPERVVTLEHSWMLDQPADRFGFNDVSGMNQEIPLLCEYKIGVKCPEGFDHFDNECVGLLRVDDTPAEAIRLCEKTARELNGTGSLPSIHNYHVNMYLADLARRAIKTNKWLTNDYSNPFAQYWPVLMGLTFSDKQWVNDDSSPPNYFRWWSLENRALPLFENPAKGHTHSYMLSRTNGDDGFATFGYWANKFSDTEKIPFAFCFVKKIKQHN